MEALQSGSDVLFVLMGAIMVLAMHAGFAFLEVGTVRKKNQVNALVKIIGDFAVSTIAYFLLATVSLMALAFLMVPRRSLKRMAMNWLSFSFY